MLAGATPLISGGSAVSAVARQGTRVLLLVLMLILMAWMAPAHALDGLSPAQEASLRSTVTRYDRLMKAGDFVGLYGYTPPKLRAEIARKHGVSQWRVRREMGKLLRGTRGVISVEHAAMHMDRARVRKMRDGKPYVIIPYTVRMRVAGRLVSERSRTVALMDGGRWYLVRVQEKEQIQLLRAAYPAFAGARLN